MIKIPISHHAIVPEPLDFHGSRGPFRGGQCHQCSTETHCIDGGGCKSQLQPKKQILTTVIDIDIENRHAARTPKSAPSCPLDTTHFALPVYVKQPPDARLITDKVDVVHLHWKRLCGFRIISGGGMPIAALRVLFQDPNARLG